MGKARTFYTGQNAWKIHANQNENKTKKNISRKSNPRLTLLYTIFHEKGTPFNTLFRTLYPFWLL